MKGCEKVWLKLGLASLVLLLYVTWQGYVSIALVVTLMLSLFLLLELFFSTKSEDELFNHNPTFVKWLYAHESNPEQQSLEDYFCLFVECTPKGLFHAVLNHRLLDELYVLLMKELTTYFGTAHVKRLSREQFVVIKEYPSSDSLDFVQRNLFQETVTKQIHEIIEALIESSDSETGHSITITLGCASSGIRYRVKRIEELVELAYFTMNQARNDREPYRVADEHERARKCDVDECRIGFSQSGWEHEFNPFFQPIIHPVSFTVVGVESVARWQLGGFRIMPAAVFKDLAAEMQRIRKIDTIIITKTFSRIQELKDTGMIPYGFRVVINMSVMSLVEETPRWLSNLAAEHGFHPEHIEIDLQDSALTDSHVTSLIANLREKGFRIALDMFNEEAFDLKALFNNSFDIIKLNYSMAGTARDDRWQGKKVYDALISMADSLSIETLAKGIEHRMQMEHAKQQGVDYLQGNYFSQPVPFEEFSVFMDKYCEGLFA
jgi:EAL domain-containing protein (putative c-di-GMP-specific phosphodiesterase class I)